MLGRQDLHLNVCAEQPSQSLTPAPKAGALGLALLALAGCASPGVPRPPSLNLSRPVADLAAQRVGNQVLLSWTTPDRTTDNLDLKLPLTAGICRSAAAPNRQPTAGNRQPVTGNQQPATCIPVLRLATKPGQATATDTLPPALIAEPATALEYSVEILNPAGRSAGLSTRAYAASGTAPPPVEAFRAAAIPTGVLLEWSPPSASTFNTFVDLDRIDTTLQAEQQIQSKSATKPIQLANKPSAQTHLRAQPQPITDNQQPTTPSEPSGTLDQTARFGETYVYTAQRLRSLQVAGRTLTLASRPSAPITLTPRDTFPPAAPTGLAAIPNRQPASIDLSWQPNSEPDLAGYLVYRSALNQSVPPSRVTPNPIPATDFRDSTAAPGQRYAYTVTAIDSSNNESKPSQPEEETLPAVP